MEVAMDAVMEAVIWREGDRSIDAGGGLRRRWRRAGGQASIYPVRPGLATGLARPTQPS